MSIATEIARLQSDSSAIASALSAKRVTVPSGSGFDDYAGLINNIPEFDDWLKDGDTHLWLNIVNDYQKDQQIRIRMIGTIDWGDGTTVESVSVTTYTTFTHTYANKGRYRIDLHPTSGTFYLGGSSNNYCVMGERTSKRYCIIGVLYQAEVGSSIITTLSQSAFYYCTGLRRVYIPKNIVTFSSNIFYYCVSLSHVECEDSSTITSTGMSSTFYYCHNLQDISSFALSYTTTITSAFSNCWSLSEFTIPSTVTTLSGAVFQSAYSIKKLYCLPSTPPTTTSATNLFSGFNADCVIYVPNGKLTAYQTADSWSSRASQMVEMPATS